MEKTYFNFSAFAYMLFLNGLFGISFMCKNYFRLAAILLMFAFLFIQIWKRFPYKIPIALYTLFVLFSCIYSVFYNGQSFYRVILASFPVWGLMSYYGLFLFRMNSTQTLKLILALCFLFVICYVIQWTTFPKIIFSGGFDEFSANEDHYRMRMVSSICCYLLYFFGLCKLMTQRKLIYLVFIVMGGFPMIMMGFRSLIGLSIFFTLIMLLNIYQVSLRIIVAICVAGFLLWGATQIPLVQDKIDEMMERQENQQTFANSDYVRYIEYDYFTNQIFTKPGEKFWGGGYPSGENSYGRFLMNKAPMFGMCWNDLGLISLSWVIGIPAVCLLSFVVLLCAWRCKEDDLLFVRYALLVAFVGSIGTSQEIFRQGNMIVMGLLFYYEFIYHREKASKEIEAEA